MATSRVGVGFEPSESNGVVGRNEEYRGPEVPREASVIASVGRSVIFCGSLEGKQSLVVLRGPSALVRFVA